jgi:uncharacterized protein (DUF305 family)
MAKAIRLASVLTAATLALAACIVVDRDGDDSGAASGTTSRHNDADVAFAQDMIPHHAQAIVMSQMAERQARDPELRQLAADIRAAQGPEIEQMSGWLEEWGEDVPRGMGDGDHDMGDGGSMMDGDMTGMMSGRQMRSLDRAAGSRFDRMWLQMMIEHHEGAIEMAEGERRDGQYADAIELAESIIESQSAEITQMTSMLRP